MPGKKKPRSLGGRGLTAKTSGYSGRVAYRKCIKLALDGKIIESIVSFFKALTSSLALVGTVCRAGQFTQAADS